MDAKLTATSRQSDEESIKYISELLKLLVRWDHELRQQGRSPIPESLYAKTIKPSMRRRRTKHAAD
jgi:hypothetical protein